MEDSPLNLAHQQHRKAENHIRYRRFDEAVLCHKKAAEYLDEALKLTTVERALESISLQKAFHIKQQTAILQKKQQFNNFKATMEMQQKKLERARLSGNYMGKDDKKGLEVEILKNITDADSLLDLLLIRRNVTSDSDSTQSVEVCDWEEKGVEASDATNSSNVLGIKKPKDDKMVIEELRMLNKQLHDLVDKLLFELHVSTTESDSLRERVRVLEAREQIYVNQEKYEGTKLGSINRGALEDTQGNLKVMTDSSLGGDTMSPYVISPCSELSPEVVQIRQLPTLAPLELPDFDFTTLKSKTDNAK